MSQTHLLRRHPMNPILTAAHFPRSVNSAFNAGVAKFNGQYLLSPGDQVDQSPEKGGRQPVKTLCPEIPLHCGPDLLHERCLLVAGR